jgi:hypothetical protein
VTPAKRKSSAVALEPRPAQPAKFDAAYLERRMREHREWQEQTTRELLQDLADVALEVLYQAERRRARARLSA